MTLRLTHLHRLCALAVILALLFNIIGCAGGEHTTTVRRAPAGDGVGSAQAVLLGDLDGDGQPGVGDAIGILRIVVGLGDPNPLADCDQDGSTGVADAIIVLRCVVGLADWPLGELPAPEISGITTTARYQGAIVEISGAGFGSNAEVVSVLLEPVTAATAQSVDAEQSDTPCRVPVAIVDDRTVTSAIPFLEPGQYNLSVEVWGAVSDAIHLTIEAPPPLPAGVEEGEVLRVLLDETMPALLALFDDIFENADADVLAELADYNLTPDIREVLEVVLNYLPDCPPDEIAAFERALYANGALDHLQQVNAALAEEDPDVVQAATASSNESKWARRLGTAGTTFTYASYALTLAGVGLVATACAPATILAVSAIGVVATTSAGLCAIVGSTLPEFVRYHDVGGDEVWIATDQSYRLPWVKAVFKIGSDDYRASQALITVISLGATRAIEKTDMLFSAIDRAWAQVVREGAQTASEKTIHAMYKFDLDERIMLVHPRDLVLEPLNHNAEVYCDILAIAPPPAPLNEYPGVQVKTLGGESGLAADLDSDPPGQLKNYVRAEFRLTYGGYEDQSTDIDFYLFPYPLLQAENGPGSMCFPDTDREKPFSYAILWPGFEVYNGLPGGPHRARDVWQLVDSGFGDEFIPGGVLWANDDFWAHAPCKLVGSDLQGTVAARPCGAYHPYLTLKLTQGVDSGKRYNFLLNIGDTSVIVQ